MTDNGAVIQGFIFSGNTWTLASANTPSIVWRVVNHLVMSQNVIDGSASTARTGPLVVIYPTVTNATIEGNEITDGSQGSGAGVGALLTEGINVSVIGNRITAPLDYNYAVQADSASNGLVVRGNYMKGTAGTTHTGLVTLSNTVNATVSDNTFDTSGVGVMVAASSSGTKIQDNRFLAVSAPYSVLDASATTFDSESGALSGPNVTATETLGAELVTNGSFTGSGAGWTTTAGWSYATDAMPHSSNGTGALSQAITIAAGTLYKITYSVSAITSDGVSMALGGVSTLRVTVAGTYTFYVRAVTTAGISFTPSATTARLTIDDVSVRAVSNGLLTADSIAVKGFIRIDANGTPASNPAGSVFIENRTNSATNPTVRLIDAEGNEFVAFYAYNLTAANSVSSGVLNVTNTLYGTNTVIGLPSNGALSFSSTTTPSAAKDAGIARSAAGVVKVTDGSTGIRGLQGGGTAVASATAMPLPTGRVFHVTGTTTITSITSTNFQAGVVITLIFDDALTFTDGSNLALAGDFVTTAGDTISLAYDGTNWYETGRSVN
jgi:hypothetical protein